MTAPEAIGLALLVTATMATVDYAHARYSIAMVDVRNGNRSAIHRAARWSVVQWGAAAVGFVVAVKVSMWFLPMEAIGLYLGTWLGGRNPRVPLRGSNTVTKFHYESKKICDVCSRPVDAVRLSDEHELRYSRHFRSPDSRTLTFCDGSLELVEVRK